MAVQACLPVEEGGLGGCVVYIDTEAAFSPKRYIRGHSLLLRFTLSKRYHCFDLTHMVDDLFARV